MNKVFRRFKENGLVTTDPPIVGTLHKSTAHSESRAIVVAALVMVVALVWVPPGDESPKPPLAEE